jgi:hypothetical protein
MFISETRETMSISALSNAFSNSQTGALPQPLQNSQFQQLGKDLTSGNLSAAQSDFATLQQAFAQTAAPAASSTANPVAQAFQQLSTDLKSGNLSGAKQDYSSIQQDLSSRTGLAHLHYERHIGGGSGGDQSTLMQDLNQLGQDLSSSTFLSSNLSAAQQAYGSPMQAFYPGATGGLGTGLQASFAAPASDLAVSFMA